MFRAWRWFLGVAAVTGLDLVARFVSGFDFGRIMHVEAILFPLAALTLAALRRADPGERPWSRAIRLGLVWLFALGGIRPLLWWLGVPLMAANLATLAAALVALVAWRLRRRRAARVP